MITLNLKLTKINILLILVNDSRYRCEVRPTSSSGKVVRHPMTRDELRELGYIAPIATVPSILQHGILSHNPRREAAARGHLAQARQRLSGNADHSDSERRTKTA